MYFLPIKRWSENGILSHPVTQSTDTPDYFPEDYDPNEIDFTSGMLGSQAMRGGGTTGAQLPGMENLGADAIMMGGIDVNTEIPAGMKFIPSSVPDGTLEFQVAGSGSGKSMYCFVLQECLSAVSKVYLKAFISSTTIHHQPCTHFVTSQELK